MIFRRAFKLSKFLKPQIYSIIPKFQFNTGNADQTQLRIKYIQDWDVNEHDKLIFTFAHANTTDLVIDIVKANLGEMTDIHLAEALGQIAVFDLDLTDNFFNFLVPLYKDYLKLMTRENNSAFANIVKSFSTLQVQDPELWEIIERKLMKEKIVRYLELRDLCDVAVSLAAMYKGSPELFAEMEKHILNQRARLKDSETKALMFSFKRMQVGSTTFFAALEDKAADIEKLREEERILKIRRIAYAE